MNKKIKNYIVFFTKARLTKEEKESLRASFIISAGMSAHQHPIKSPFSRWDVLFMSQHTQLVLASFFLLVLIGGGAVFAGERSLPGDLFYPIKTHITEPTKRLVNSVSPVSEAKFEVDLVDERLIEAEQLDEKKDLNQEHKREVKKNISTQTIRASEAVDRLANKKVSTFISISTSATTTPILKHENKEDYKTLEKVLEKHRDIIHKLERGR